MLQNKLRWYPAYSLLVWAGSQADGWAGGMKTKANSTQLSWNWDWAWQQIVLVLQEVILLVVIYFIALKAIRTQDFKRAILFSSGLPKKRLFSIFTKQIINFFLLLFPIINESEIFPLTCVSSTNNGRGILIWWFFPPIFYLLHLIICVNHE